MLIWIKITFAFIVLSLCSSFHIKFQTNCRLQHPRQCCYNNNNKWVAFSRSLHHQQQHQYPYLLHHTSFMTTSLASNNVELDSSNTELSSSSTSTKNIHSNNQRRISTTTRSHSDQRSNFHQQQSSSSPQSTSSSSRQQRYTNPYQQHRPVRQQDSSNNNNNNRYQSHQQRRKPQSYHEKVLQQLYSPNVNNNNSSTNNVYNDLLLAQNETTLLDSKPHPIHNNNKKSHDALNHESQASTNHAKKHKEKRQQPQHRHSVDKIQKIEIFTHDEHDDDNEMLFKRILKRKVSKHEERNRIMRLNGYAWWMSEREDNNPRTLPIYEPWWLDVDKNVVVNDKWTVVELREEAARRGLNTTGLKAELIDRINLSYIQYSLSDDNFCDPEIIDNSAELPLYSCYPEVYEKELYEKN